MSERIERFEIHGTPVVQVRLGSGSIRFVEGDPGTVVVRLDGKKSFIDRFRVEQASDLITIEPEAGRRLSGGTARVTVETGTRPEVRVRVGSSDVVSGIPLAAVQVEFASGDVRLQNVAGDVTARGASGDLVAGSVGGQLKATIASGDVRAEVVAGAVDVKTASGDVRIKRLDGGIKVKSASGDVVIDDLRGGDVDAKTLSGSLVFGIPTGRTLDVDVDSVSGRVKSEFPVRDDDEPASDDSGVTRLSVKTVSGDVVFRPAT